MNPQRRWRDAGWLRQALRHDRGAVSAELAIAIPLLLLFLLAIVQFAVWSHATHIAQAAASQGLAAARVHSGTASAGVERAQQLLDQLAQSSLKGAAVSSERGAETVSVRITGTAAAVLPFLHLPVHSEAAGPVERLVVANDS
ncbi:TadE/TadG family type IV pilus assembly protein [Lentzea kentuckyensis]|uniref:TadE/TadG family type IV pilus assembly protein n=1 Tax=Lentzea kentuckyensis TaxID=360086 RepID=UPI000A391530